MLVFPEDLKSVTAFLNLNPYLHLYEIGDLDERFLPYTNWYGSRSDSDLSAVVCVYTGGDSPTLLALCDNDSCRAMQNLLRDAIPEQPERLQAHLSPGLEKLFSADFTVDSHRLHYKMALRNTELLYTDSTETKGDNSGTMPKPQRLTGADIPALLELYEDSYPGNWFEPEMLELNMYFGIFEEDSRRGKLLCAAGTHVYSPQQEAAALGNITTRPEVRNKGYGTAVTAELCLHLLNQGLRIGLNVKQDNAAAITSYKKIGFTVCAEYGEFIFQRRSK